MRLTKGQKTFIWTIVIAIAGYISCKVFPDFASILFTCAFVLEIWLFSYYKLSKLSEEDFIKNMVLIVGFGLTVISWFVSGYINTQHSIAEKKRDIRVRMLSDAFFRLQNFNQRDNETVSNRYIYFKYSETALDEIQLIGDKELVQLAYSFAVETLGDSIRNPIAYDALIAELRKDLRKELGVPELTDYNLLKPFTWRLKRGLMLKTNDTITSVEEIDLIKRLNEDHKDLFK